MSFTFGKYEYEFGFKHSKDEKAWQISLKRNAKNAKLKKMSYVRRKALSKPNKPNITLCEIYRRPIRSHLAFGDFRVYSSMVAKRSVVDTFSEFHGKKAALTKALNKVCSDRKKPTKAFRTAAWTALIGKKTEKTIRIKKKSSHKNINVVRGICCPIPPK